MTTYSPSRQRVLELIDELPSSVIPDVINYLESLRSTRLEKDVANPPADEKVLLEVIGRKIPIPDRKRLSYLREKQDQETINEAEYQELLDYVDRVEQLDAERAAALLKLAELRQVSVSTLLAEVG
jgi:hypothetical protein